jgi:hypothetical protein
VLKISKCTLHVCFPSRRDPVSRIIEPREQQKIFMRGLIRPSER